MNDIRRVVLFDTPDSFENLLPLCYTRPSCDFRVGILTIREKWERQLPGKYTCFTAEYLREKFPVELGDDEVALFVAGSVLPDNRLVLACDGLKRGEFLADTYGLVAFRGTKPEFEELGRPEANLSFEIRRIRYVFDLFLRNGEEIKEDYGYFAWRKDSPVAISESVTVIGPMRDENGRPNIYIEEGASVEGCILNVKDGPIYIGKDAEVMEGSCLRGPLALCDNSKIRMGSKIYGSTTIGPWSKVGGEIDNSIIFGYSNKAHDGYLGNAVIGEWCNIGAGANASNLKNDYSKIRIWNYAKKSFMRTDLQFCGLIMADHSKAGINTMFNTASVVGVGVNLHGSGFPRTFIPSFSSGSPEGGFTDVSIDKFMDVVGKVMARRGKTLGEVDRRIFETIYRSAARFK